jgi:hypothetical protein
MNINKKRLIHQQNETRLVGLSIQASAIQSQIESAENRAQNRCPKYNKHNVHWKRVDALLEEQDAVVEAIKAHSSALITNDITNSFKPEVSDFLNQESPSTKRNYSDLLGDTKPVAFDISGEGDSAEVKKEGDDNVNDGSRVSKNKKSK